MKGLRNIFYVFSRLLVYVCVPEVLVCGGEDNLEWRIGLEGEEGVI